MKPTFEYIEIERTPPAREWYHGEQTVTLAGLGAQGWELVTSYAIGDGGRYERRACAILKRMKDQNHARSTNKE